MIKGDSSTISIKGDSFSLMSINVQSLQRSKQTRKVQNKVFGLQGEIVENTGIDLTTYTLEVIAVGSSWEADRDALITILDANTDLVLNNSETGVIDVSLIGYSVSESRLRRGVATFSINLLKLLDQTSNLDSILIPKEQSLFDKISAMYSNISGKVSKIKGTVSKSRGLVLKGITEVRGAVQDTLNIPNDFVNSELSLIQAVTEQALTIKDAPSTALSNLAQSLSLISSSTIAELSSGSTSEPVKVITNLTQVEALLAQFSIYNQPNLIKSVQELDETRAIVTASYDQISIDVATLNPEMLGDLTDAYTAYLDESSKLDLDSLFSYDSTLPLLVSLFRELDGDLTGGNLEDKVSVVEELNVISLDSILGVAEGLIGQTIQYTKPLG